MAGSTSSVRNTIQNDSFSKPRGSLQSLTACERVRLNDPLTERSHFTESAGVGGASFESDHIGCAGDLSKKKECARGNILERKAKET